MIIDAHHHLWQYSHSDYPWMDGDEKAVLRHDYLIQELDQVTRPLGVSHTVVVQARQTIWETEWLLGLSQQSRTIAGIVGWLPLAADNIRSHLERFSSQTALKSLRHVVQDEPDPEFFDRPNFNHGVSLLDEFNLAYDILIFGHQLPMTIRFVDRHPQQRFVLDHIAKPVIDPSRFDEAWAKNFRELARRDNITCKFSALATEVTTPQWTIETLRPYWETALEAFGPQRLMFGSDWPVALLRTDYETWLNTVQQLASQLSPTEQESIFCQTARSAYQLSI